MIKDYIKKVQRFEESILDPVQNVLNPEFFDEKDKLKPEISSLILDTITTWVEKLAPELEIEELVMVGSTTSYQYSSNSDVDINVKLKGATQEELDELFPLRPNGLMLGEHPINYYLKIDDYKLKDVQGAYDILKDKWVKKPDVDKTKIPYSYALEIAKFFIYGIESRITEFETDTRELKYYTDVLKTAEEEEKEEIQALISLKENEMKADLDALKIAHNLAKSFRNEAYDEKYKASFLIKIETDSANLSLNNIVYKIIESSGYFDKLKVYEDLRSDIKDKMPEE